MQIISIDSVGQLRDEAQRWDDLWRRSQTPSPTARAETVAQWVEHFAQRARFRALAVESGGRFLAGLPLVTRRIKGVLPVADATSNAWSACGDLLLDPDCETGDALRLLVSACVGSGWPLVWLDCVNLDAPWWEGFIEAADEAGLETHTSLHHEVGLADLEDDWQEHLENLDGHFRRNVRRRVRRLESSGGLRLHALTDLAPEDVDDVVRRIFQMEARSWKGRSRTAVIQTPGMLTYFCRQARTLAGWGQLAIYLLEVGGVEMAFEYGYAGKDVYFAHKVGYDEAFAKEGPGHVLKWLQGEQIVRDTTWRTIDYLGPRTPAIARWTNRSYRLGRLVVAPPTLLGGAFMFGYKTARPAWQELKGRLRPAAEDSQQSDAQPRDERATEREPAPEGDLAKVS